jgi:ankyrin repeat protein
VATPADDPHAAFLQAACVPLTESHAAGSLAGAEAIRAAHPRVATASVHAAAVLGDAEGVRRWLAADAANAAAKGGPRGWDPLTHLCFSRYLRLDPSRSDGFVAAAEALLDAGADANTGWFEADHQPAPVRESALYGAAGVAHHAGLTRLLLARGADPNDDEVPYHAPEGYDNGALEALVASGRLTADSLATMLLRKADWHDREGIRTLLAHGADPDRTTRWGRTALQQAVVRDNEPAIVELLLEHGADPAATRAADGRSALAVAARRGRGDVLELCARRGSDAELSGVERLIAACARGDGAAVRALAGERPELAESVRADGGRLLVEFAGVGNAAGVALLLDLGVPVQARFAAGDGYWDLAPGSTALHAAAWRGRHATVALLLARGAEVEAVDGRGRTPLALAVRACVDSYWTARRSPESVAALLAAGASPRAISLPTGYAAIDALLAAAR